MNLYLTLGAVFIGMALFGFAGVQLIKEYTTKDSSQYPVIPNQKIKLTGDKKIHIRFYRKKLEFEHSRYSRAKDISVSLTDTNGKAHQLAKALFSSHGSSGIGTFITLGTIKLPAGDYDLNIEGPEGYFADEYFLLFSSANVFLLLAGIFCLVFPGIATIVAFLSGLSS